MAVYNPLPSLPLNYTVTIDKVGRCLNGCSGNGACSNDGLCECNKSWAGGDCSVQQSGSPAPPHHSGFLFLISTLFWMAVGGAAAFGYVAVRGIPRWLPLRYGAGFGGLGIYQELTEHEGI